MATETKRPTPEQRFDEFNARQESARRELENGKKKYRCRIHPSPEAIVGASHAYEAREKYERFYGITGSTNQWECSEIGPEDMALEGIK